MPRLPFTFLLLALLQILASCTENKYCAERMDAIRRMGDTVPMRAMKSLDTLCVEMEGADMHDRQLLALLRVRLQDKADMIPESDLQIKPVMEYFEEKGNDREKQEAYYYAASVYRDLRDTPAAITYFQKSLEHGRKAQGDSLLMRNAYSQLNKAYYITGNYDEALKAAEEELKIAKRMNLVDAITMIELGRGYLDMNRHDDARKAIRKALELQEKRMGTPQCAGELCSTMLVLLDTDEKELMEKCKAMLDRAMGAKRQSGAEYVYARYYSKKAMGDSAIHYFKQCFADSINLDVKACAARELLKAYHRTGNYGEASLWGTRYLEYAKEIDQINNREKSLRAHNQYIYNRDRIRELEERQSTERLQRTMLIATGVACLAIIVVIVGMWLVRRHYKNLNSELWESVRKTREETTRKRHELEQMVRMAKTEQEKGEAALQGITAELSATREALSEKEGELLHLKDDIAKMQEAECTLKKELEKKKLLSERLVQQQNKSAFLGSAKEVVRAVTAAAAGKYNMQEADWERLLSAVKTLYPDFAKAAYQQYPQTKSDQARFFCLLHIGLNNGQIRNLMEIPRTSLWRWTKKYEEIVGELAAEDTEGE